jgi:hypothetical protein
MTENISYDNNKGEMLTELVTSCVGAAFQTILLTERWKLREDDEDEVSTYWLTMEPKRGYATFKKNSTRSHFGELALGWLWTCSNEDHVTDRKMEVMRRQRRSKHLLDDRGDKSEDTPHLKK